ncbi:tetratricopeptide repeat protein [Nocardioides dongxiaopingii]|uniref:tetratricopeptide repeat protein n=1 Tax=Nocardioides TaxID=1839 RepID=UPI001FEB8BE1|nr:MULTISPECIES: tetratricopeptide repeat protein [Nocardioides]
MNIEELPEIAVPAIVFPGQRGVESAHRVAHDLLERRAPREALDVLAPALEQDPGNRGLRTLRAWAHFMRASLGPAETDLRALVEDDPSDVWARHALGRTLERQSRLREALPHLRLAHAMTGDVEHEVDVLRVERRLATG